MKITDLSLTTTLPVLFLFLIGLNSSRLEAQTTNHNIGSDEWHRIDRHDGYVTGNGRIYVVGGLGKTLTRNGKSFLTNDTASLTRLSWVIGPNYSFGNLGYGWELEVKINNQYTGWNDENILSPTPDLPFWSVIAENEEIKAELVDIVVEDEPVLLRKLTISRPIDADEARVQLFLPVHADPRNGTPFQMWNGEPIEGRKSIDPSKMIQIDESSESLILIGAPRALWQEISTPIPDEEEYYKLFPYRALATSAVSTDPDVKIKAITGGLYIDLGQMQGGDQQIIGVWLVTTSTAEDILEKTVIEKLNRYKSQNINEVIERSRAALPEPILRRTDSQEDPLTTIIQSTTDLARATQAESGCVLAQPYMYPLCYVRDQLGSFKILMAQTEYERAFKALTFYIAMQNRYGIQNAYDNTILPPDPKIWEPDANENDGHHRIAEVPSIIILMARDYYKATGNLDQIEPLYDRLAYNLRVQEPSSNGLFPSPGDESYTNTERTAPRDRSEMTDSNLLFIGAARFMSELAETLGYLEDAEEFYSIAVKTEQVLMDRLWVSDGEYFAYARDESNDPEGIDKRPALDSLLRWAWLELSSPLHHIPQSNLETVLENLINPLRIVPEVYNFTAGMNPGYLLYALSRSQNPLMHDAAQLMVNYSTDSGLFSEYYAHEDGILIPFSGSLRPWESGINAHAVIQYLIGFQPDMPNQKIYLQPHLPPGWVGWHTRKIELHNEGTMELKLLRDNESRIIFELTRYGGENPLTFDIEFGGYEGNLVSEDGSLTPIIDRPDILETSLVLKPEGPNAHFTTRIIFSVIQE